MSLQARSFGVKRESGQALWQSATFIAMCYEDITMQHGGRPRRDTHTKRRSYLAYLRRTEYVLLRFDGAEVASSPLSQTHFICS